MIPDDLRVVRLFLSRPLTTAIISNLLYDVQECKNRSFTSWFPAIHNLLLNLYKDKNEAWKEVTEIGGASGECMWLVQLTFHTD